MHIWNIKNNKGWGIEMEDKIQEAKELLWANGYAVVKMTKRMNEDSDECVRMMEEGNDKDCSECSCSLCVVE